MEGAFAVVLFVVVGVAAVAAVWAIATSGGSYDQIGRGGMSLDEPAESKADRDAEIRQMQELLDTRRAARGAGPREPVDPGLREEVRTLVEATNARRAARGEPPLDIEAETERRLRELGA